MTITPRSIKLSSENWQTLANLAEQEGLTINGYISQVLGKEVKARGKHWQPLRQWGGKRIKGEG